jgi:hypothetical protein
MPQPIGKRMLSCSAQHRSIDRKRLIALYSAIALSHL